MYFEEKIFQILSPSIFVQRKAKKDILSLSFPLLIESTFLWHKNTPLDKDKCELIWSKGASPKTSLWRHYWKAFKISCKEKLIKEAFFLSFENLLTNNIWALQNFFYKFNTTTWILIIIKLLLFRKGYLIDCNSDYWLSFWVFKF